VAITLVKQIWYGAALGVAMLIGYGPMAQAAYTVMLQQEGTSVVATGNGTIDLAGQSFVAGVGASTKIIPNLGFITTAPADAGQYDA
jgi:hypothetical protein